MGLLIVFSLLCFGCCVSCLLGVVVVVVVAMDCLITGISGFSLNSVHLTEGLDVTAHAHI